MNYINRLQAQQLDAQAAAFAIQDDLDALVSYLNSPKFRDDTIVQVSDGAAPSGIGAI